MKKLINETKNISIDELIDKLNIGEQMIVYYRSGNRRDAIPVFLQKFCTDFSPIKYGFRKPLFNGYTSYLKNNLKDCLLEASKSRQIYVLEKGEIETLFKLQP
jgi:hypothetical protein